MNETFAELLKVNKLRQGVEIRYIFPALVVNLVVIGPLGSIVGKSLGAPLWAIMVTLISLSTLIMASGITLCLRKDNALKAVQNRLQASWEKAHGIGSLPEGITYENGSTTFVNERAGELFAYRLVVKDGVPTLKDAKGEVVEPKAAEVFSGVTVEDPNSELWRGSNDGEKAVS